MGKQCDVMWIWTNLQLHASRFWHSSRYFTKAFDWLLKRWHIPAGNRSFTVIFSTLCSLSSTLNWFSLRRTMKTNNNKKPYTKRYIKKNLKPVECRFFFSLWFQLPSILKLILYVNRDGRKSYQAASKSHRKILLSQPALSCNMKQSKGRKQ